MSSTSDFDMLGHFIDGHGMMNMRLGHGDHAREQAAG